MEKKILVISSNTNIMNAAIDFLLETKRFYKVKSVFRDSIKNSGNLWTIYTG